MQTCNKQMMVKDEDHLKSLNKVVQIMDEQILGKCI